VLVITPVHRTEKIVADRVGNVEVVMRHQAFVVVIYVVASQAIHERQSADP
jgi:hypothetical protein